ncbi:efflux RND transporter periplasmic adaptor subunit [Clostridium hydrogenum]|uniref:efflux RND transporter periplasmic adaptor subunit n=1 Tax=Clostridium hydrogenum TaxID=2855764 RepID=UPI001F26EBAB|nr:efflux RND transporter periplasmic adaptor subunit [Clostridium hydrogenum]
MKKSKIILAILLAGALVVSVGCGSSKSSTDTPSKKTITKAVSDDVEASGVVKSHNVEDIVMDGGQSIIKINGIDVKNGQKVKKGDKLVELDLAQINSEITAKQKTVDADKDLKNDMQTDNQKNAQDAKIAAEQADVDSLNNLLNKSYLSNGNIVSDMDNAVVTDINYRKGDIVSAQQKILTLNDLNSLYIDASVGEEFIKDVKVGNAVKIIPTSDSSAKLTGKVVSVSNAAVTEQNGETNIHVEISIDNNNSELLPNYNVDVQIQK